MVEDASVEVGRAILSSIGFVDMATTVCIVSSPNFMSNFAATIDTYAPRHDIKREESANKWSRKCFVYL